MRLAIEIENVILLDNPCFGSCLYLLNGIKGVAGNMLLLNIWLH